MSGQSCTSQLGSIAPDTLLSIWGLSDQGHKVLLLLYTYLLNKCENQPGILSEANGAGICHIALLVRLNLCQVSLLETPEHC